MRKTSSNTLLLSATAIMTLAASTSAAQTAANYPVKAIRIQTTGTGGGVDLGVRVVAPALSASLGQPVVVDNRPGTGALASGVANAAPDGYTLLAWGGALWTAPLFEKVSYDPVRDFAPIATLTLSPYILVVHPSLPVRSVADLIRLAKARPGALNYSSGPTGSSSHLAVELFKSMANVDIVRIGYRGGSLVTTDLLSGEIQMTIASGASMDAAVKANRLRALATAGSRRSVLFPALPTIAETLPGFTTESLLALLAPAKTPDAIVRRLNQEAVRALERADVREQLLKIGQEPVGGTPEQLADLIKAEMARVGKLIKGTGVKSGGA